MEPYPNRPLVNSKRIFESAPTQFCIRQLGLILAFKGRCWWLVDNAKPERKKDTQHAGFLRDGW